MKNSRIKHLGAAVKAAHAARRRGLKVVTANGCFDVLHVGHVRYLNYAKSLGDILIVGVNSDSYLRKYKGTDRPITPAKERAEIVASLKPVDRVFVFNDKAPDRWLKKIRPHVHVKSAVKDLRQITERDTVKKIDARLVLAPYHKGKSTTALFRKIKT